MRRLAEAALTAYDLGEVRLTPLQHFFNTTFRIDTCSPQGKKERYVIRIHRPGSQDATTIRSELLWLLALRHEEGLIVPEPVSTRDGSLLTTASVAGVPEPQIVWCFVGWMVVSPVLSLPSKSLSVWERLWSGFTTRPKIMWFPQASSVRVGIMKDCAVACWELI